jgi:hypothetical protein
MGEGAEAYKVVGWGPRVIELERVEFGYDRRDPLVVEYIQSSI